MCVNAHVFWPGSIRGKPSVKIISVDDLELKVYSFINIVLYRDVTMKPISYNNFALL